MAITSKSKPRLGRGCESSLIAVTPLPVEAEIPIDAPLPQPAGDEGHNPIALPDGRSLFISIEAIRPNPHQPRKTIKESAIAELAASMKSSGVIQPLVVRQVDGGYELIAGERRWLAAKLAGLNEVPVVVRDVDAVTQAQMALVENIQREDLNPIERALGYKTLMEHLGLTQAELANRMGEERSSVANYLRLLDLGDAVRAMARDGRLTMGHAKLLAGVVDILEQQRLADIVVSQSLSVRNLERLLDGKPASTERAAAPAPSAHVADLEKSLSRQLGMRVQVHSAKKGRGRLTVHYGSLDQFDEIIQKLGLTAD